MITKDNAINSIILAAEKKGINPFELGCKFLFDQLGYTKSLIDTCRSDADELYSEYCRIYSTYGSEQDEIYGEIIRDYREAFSVAKQAENNAKDYRNALWTTIRWYKKTASDIEKAHITANQQTLGRKIASAKPLPEGSRTYTRLPKISMKSFKAMKFIKNDFFGRKVKALANEINALLRKPKNETQDEFRTRADKIRAKFAAIEKIADDMLKNHTPYELKAADAKINICKQSELYDGIQVPYGNKTTEMVITVCHKIADLFDDDIAKFLAFGDVKKGKKKLIDVEAKFGAVMIDSGINVELLKKNGVAQKLHYTFWTANNTQLKDGTAVLLTDASHAIAMEAGRAGMTEDQYSDIPTTGADLLKWLSYAATPACPMVDDDGNIVTLDDILMLDSVEIKRLFKNVLFIDENGKYVKFEEYLAKRTFNDGGALFFGIPSQQFRGGWCMKGFGVKVSDKTGNMVDDIAARENLEIPKYVKDVDHIMREWRKYKIITFTDTWKWKKYGLSWKEYKQRMNNLAKKIPGANLMYTTRLADSVEDDERRKLARQTTQQFANATIDQICRLMASDINTLKRLTTIPGIIRKFAGLNKDEKDRTAFEHLIEVCPSILSLPLFQERIREMFDNQLAEAAMRPSVHGLYTYIAEDPVATIKIAIFGMNPDQVGLGYLKEKELNMPETEEGKKVFFGRYPMNHLVGMVLANHNDPIYRYCGNVILLSVDGSVILQADGDFDGDEGGAIKDELTVELCEQIDQWANRPLIIFDHPKAEPRVEKDKAKRVMMIATALVISNIYGGAVGQNSNLATKCFEAAACAATIEARRQHLMNACWAHVGAILAIDLAKTGSMPPWLDAILEKLQKAYKKMPWNQRFAKHTASEPWWSFAWDLKLLKESSSTPNRIPRILLDALCVTPEKLIVWPDEENEDAFEDDNEYVPAKRVEYNFGDTKFDMDVLLAKDVKSYDTKVVVSDRLFRAIDARNYRSSEDLDAGDNDDEKLIRDIKEGKAVGLMPLFRFAWRNRASLVYKTNKAKDGGDKISNAQIVNGYYEWAHDMILEACEGAVSKYFARLTPEQKRMALANKFLKIALAEENGIGKKCGDKWLAAKRKASFLEFTLRVFGYEYYQNACRNLGVTQVWVKTENTPTEENIDVPMNDNLENIW